MLSLYQYSGAKAPKTLILVPTRELVLQVVAEIQKLTKYMNIRFAGIYGGSNINPQKAAIVDGLDILVSTPGRLIDMAMMAKVLVIEIAIMVIVRIVILVTP